MIIWFKRRSLSTCRPTHRFWLGTPVHQPLIGPQQLHWSLGAHDGTWPHPRGCPHLLLLRNGGIVIESSHTISLLCTYILPKAMRLLEHPPITLLFSLFPYRLSWTATYCLVIIPDSSASSYHSNKTILIRLFECRYVQAHVFACNNYTATNHLPYFDRFIHENAANVLRIKMFIPFFSLPWYTRM